MPRKPIEAPAPVKRGHLFDKLGKVTPPKKTRAKRPNAAPTSGIRLPGKKRKSARPHKTVDAIVGNDWDKINVVTKPARATKANGGWTPRDNKAKSSTGRVNHRTFTDEMIAEGLRRGKGLGFAAAKFVGMDYSYLIQRINKSPFLLKVRQEATEQRLDRAETVLDDLVETKGPSQLGATCFFLKCRGKERGYVERQEVTQTNAPIDLDSMNDEQLTALVDAIAKKLEERQ